MEYVKPHTALQNMQKLGTPQELKEYRYCIQSQQHRIRTWCKTLNLDMKVVSEVRHDNLQYYFYYLLPKPQYKEWMMSDSIDHKPKANVQNIIEK